MLGVLITGGVLAAVIWIAVVTARGPAAGSVPQRLGAFGALDCGMIEELARDALHATQRPRDAALLELARHHAFATAARTFDGPVDPEGEGPLDRRARLTPLHLGTVDEWSCAFLREAGSREADCAGQLARLAADAGFRVGGGDGEALEVGAAVEQGRFAATVVWGRRIGALAEPPVLGVSGGPWTLHGTLEPGLDPARLQAGVVGADGSAGPITAEAPGDPPADPDARRRFLFELDLPAGERPLEVMLSYEDTPALRVPVRR